MLLNSAASNRDFASVSFHMCVFVVRVWLLQLGTMEVECIAVEDERRLAELRFDAAVKVIKSLPPNGEWPV